MSIRSLTFGVIAAAALAGATAVQAETLIFTNTDSSDATVWSFDLTGPAGNISYTGGPVQTWPNQAKTDIAPSLWADFPQTGGAFDGDSISFEGNYPGPEAAAITTTSSFYSTGTPYSVPGPHIFDDLTFDVPEGATETYDIVGGGVLTIEGVPEPATWGMMLLGVGLIGAGLRMARRKTQMALIAA